MSSTPEDFEGLILVAIILLILAIGIYLLLPEKPVLTNGLPPTNELLNKVPRLGGD